jgi:ATP-binding cassette subfamily B protein
MKGVWFYYRGARKYVVLFVMLLIALEALALYFPMMLKDVTSLINNPDTTTANIILRGVLVFAVVILIFIINFAAEYIGARATCHYSKNMREELFEKLQKVPSENIAELGASRILPMIMNDTNWLRQMQRHIIILLVFFPVAILGSIIMIFGLNPVYGAFALISIPLIIIFFWINSARLNKIIKKSVAAFDNIHQDVKESIVGAKEIRVFNKAKEREEEFAKLAYLQRQQSKSTHQSINLSVSFNAVLFTIITVVIIIYGATTMTDITQLVILNTCIQYINRIWAGSHLIFTLFVDFLPRCVLAKKRLMCIYNLPKEQECEGTTRVEGGRNDLEFRRVEYCATGSGSLGINDFSMRVEAGSRVAILGGVGSGRNHIPRLLLRYITPTDGTIRLGHADISDINSNYFRRHVISVCAQEPEFAPGTIRDNLRMLNKDATDKEIIDTFHELGAGAFVDRFDDFLNYKLGEASTLNDSAKKLLNIVRSVLKPAQIYLFNQCFDHVKADYVYKLMAKLKREKKTCIFITDQSTITKHCQKIYIMKQGRIAVSGTHEQLKNNIDYQRMCSAAGSSLTYEEKVTDSFAVGVNATALDHDDAASSPLATGASVVGGS